MRKLLNKLLIKFGVLITKAPEFLATGTMKFSSYFPADLTARVTIEDAADEPDNDLYRIFAATDNLHKWHHYFDIYSRHLAGFRSKPVRMLEIGVFRGGSLRMWKKYFHPDSIIVGIDVDKSCQDLGSPADNIHVRIGSQADPDFLAAVNAEFGPFDIILDDGSHKTHHQIASFGALFRDALKDGGCYMVEDVHSNYWVKHVDSEETFVELCKSMVDIIYEPYLNHTEPQFRRGHTDALQELELSYLAANLAGVSFYDSILVIDKKLRSLPNSDLR